MFWTILAVIGIVNLVFLALLVVVGLFKEKRPLSPEEIRQDYIEDEVQAEALRQWSINQAAKKGRKVRG